MSHGYEVDVGVLPAFLAVAVLICAAPGPDMAYLLSAGMAGGRGAATRAAFGVALGVLVYAGAAAAGLGTLIIGHREALAGVELAGCAYLLWLSVNAIRDARSSVRPSASDAVQRRWFGRGLLVNLTNPKVLLFFLAVLPQFLGHARNTTLQLLMLALLFQLIGLAGDLAVGWTASRFQDAVTTHPRVGHTLGYASGAALGILAAVVGIEAVRQLLP